MIVHPIPPEYDSDSKVLILGSFPSVKSREQGFFYGHPQNRFWKVLGAITNSAVPGTIEEKKALLKRNGIALWDTIKSCDIVGSADSSIKNVVPNDLSVILDNSKVKRIFVNGKTSKAYYDKYLKDKTGIDAVCLPSTSPANATTNLETLIDCWKVILQ